MLSKSLVISNYNNDLKWLYPILNKNSKLTCYLYDKSEIINTEYLQTFKVKQIPNVGYNILSYCTHIIDNYNSLDDVIIFIKGNLIEREHTTLENFEKALNANTFFLIERYHESTHLTVNDNGYVEPNNNWYTPYHPFKYASTYNDFLDLLFEDPHHPQYIRFAPGANFVVPKWNILKYSKSFYERLAEIVSHDKLSLESHFAERAFYSIWTCDYKEKT